MICNEKSEYAMDDLMTVYENGFAGNTTLQVDSTTGRIPIGDLQNEYNSLINSLKIPATPTTSRTNQSGATETETDLVAKMNQDKKLYDDFSKEYCYYEARYKFALQNFLAKATSRDSSQNAEANSMLDVTITLNRKLNYLIELMNYVSSQRVMDTNRHTDTINTMKNQIEDNRASLQTVYQKLNGPNGDLTVLTVQKEMVNYTKEKNNAVTNQISVWAALNVLALATIFYVYRMA